MPQNMHLNRVRKSWTVMSLAVVCLVAMVCSAVPDGGEWVKSHHNDCPPGMVCADWEVSGAEPWPGNCCIPLSKLGSQNIDDCDLSFRHGEGGP
ncbi:MAG: hypothetical protein K0U98_08390 [Deltaproteobacteria bacterium]|nr:hypothetical protein [Deltaproteobacteria bacterium]